MNLIENQFLEFGVLLLITFVIISIISYFIRKIMLFLINKNSGLIGEDPTNFIFLKNAIPYVLYSIGLVWVIQKIPYFHELGTALFAGAGVLAAIIGFASQKAFSNIIGGLFILIFKPFRVNDTIQLSSGAKGIIEAITLRHTVIRDFEYRRIVIPNSQISEDTIINSSITDEKIRQHIEIGISYESDIDLAIEIIQDEIERHPNSIDGRNVQEIADRMPQVEVKLIELGDYAVVLRAYVWTSCHLDGFDMKCDVFKSIKKRFEDEGIDIPYPHRTIVAK